MAEPSQDKPVIFNEQEQLQLQNLQKQSEDFTTWKNVLNRSLYCGEDTLLVANFLQFLQNLVQQCAQQIELVTANAKKRNTTPETPKAT